MARLLEIAGRPQPTHAWRGCCSALIGSGHEVSLIERWRAWFGGAYRESTALSAEVLRRAVELTDDFGTGCRALCDLFADTLTAGFLPDDDLWRGLIDRIGPDDADQLSRLAAMTKAGGVHRLIVDRFCELDTPATRRQLAAGVRSSLEPCGEYCLRALCHSRQAAQVLPQLRSALATANDDDMPAIAQTLLAQGDEEAAAAIFDAASKSENLRSRVLWSVLARNCPPSLAERILEASLDVSTSRIAALEVRGRFGPSTTPAKIALLLGRDSPPEVRQAAARALERHARLTAPVYATNRPPDILSCLDEAFPLRLDDDEALLDIVARGDSGRFLLEAWFGPQGAAVPLVLALDDDDDAVRRFAAATLKNLGRLAEGVRHSLHECGPSRVRQALDQAWGLSVSRSQKDGV